MLIFNKLCVGRRNTGDKFQDLRFENAGYVQSKKPTDGEKGLLVFSKIYKNIQEIPDVVSIEELAKAKLIVAKKYRKCMVVCVIAAIPITYWFNGKVQKFFQDLQTKQERIQSQNEEKSV